jgi:hypothetical protein
MALTRFGSNCPSRVKNALDVAHAMVSCHFILSPKAEASKWWPFFSNQGTLIPKGFYSFFHLKICKDSL